MTGWDDLPIEMKFEVIQYLDDEDHKKFAKSSFRCLKEIIWGGRKDIEQVRIEYIKETNIFNLVFDGYCIKFKQLGKICHVEYDGEIIWKGIEDNKNMAYEFAESILKISKHCLRDLILMNVDFMINDESIDKFPCLHTLHFWKSSSINQVYSFLSKAQNIIDFIVEEREDSGTIENINQLKLPEDFELLSIKRMYLKTNDAHFASDLINRLNKSEEDHRFFDTQFYIFDEQCVSVDENLMNIFKKSKIVLTNLTMTNEQFVELANSVETFKCDARNIDPSIIVDFIFKLKKSGFPSCYYLDNVDDGILAFCERLNLKKNGSIFPNRCVFETVYVRGEYYNNKQLRFQSKPH